MNKSTTKSVYPIINLICPELCKESKKENIELNDILQYAGTNKVKSILKRYDINITDKEIKSLFEVDIGVDVVEKIYNMFDIFNCIYIDDISGFEGTKMKAKMYRIICYKHVQ